MTIAQAAKSLRISCLVSNWTTRGYIATVKGPGTNNHRLVHLDNILVWMQDRILCDDRSVDAESDTETVEQRRHNQLSHSCCYLFAAEHNYSVITMLAAGLRSLTLLCGEFIPKSD